MACLLLHFVIVEVGHAEGGGSLAESVYKAWNGDCPQVSSKLNKEEALLDAARCGTVQSVLIKNDFGKISEFAVLGGYAGERAESLKCSLDQLNNAFEKPDSLDVLAQDAVDKLLAIAKDRERMDEIVPASSSSGSWLARQGGTGSLSQEYQKLRARSQAALESITFVELDEHRSVLEGIVTQVRARDSREPDPEALASFKKKIIGSMKSARKQIFKDWRVMKEAHESSGVKLNSSQRESLAQDRELVEAFLKRHPEDRESLKAISCRIDAKYGKGANLRDTGILVGSTLLTGPGWATLGKIGLSAVRATGLVARGSSGVRSAQVLRYTALGIGETGNLASTIADIHRGCDEKMGHFGGNLKTSEDGGRSCETNVLRGLEANNCYLAYSLGVLGVGGTGLAAYSKVTDGWSQKLANAISAATAGSEANVDPVAAKMAKASARPEAVSGASEAGALTKRDRAILRQGLEKLKLKAPVQDLKANQPLEPLVLSANEIKKGSIANFMKKSQAEGIEYIFDDSKFAGRSEMALSEGNRVFLRRREGLQQLDSARSREAIVYETERALQRVRCEKTGSAKDCSRAVVFRAGYDSKFLIGKKQQEFVSGERDALYRSGRMSRNPESIAQAEKMAEEEALILTALKKDWVNGLSVDRNEAKKILTETIHLKDGREVMVDLPYGDTSDFAYFKSLVDQRLSEKPIQEALARIGRRDEAWLERRTKAEAAELPKYTPSYKVVNGRVESKYQPSRVIPRSSYPSQRTDAKYAGRIFRSVDEIKAFRESGEWRDGVHVFLQILEKGPDGKDVPVWMEAHRIPKGKDFEDGKIVTHRTLAAEYERQTGHPPKIIDGGEYLADATRTLKQVGDGMGGFHDKEVYAPTVYFGADTLHAQGLKFLPPNEVSDGTLVRPFKASDGTSQMVGHFKAADEVRSARDIEAAHPGLFEKNQKFAVRVLENERKYIKSIAQKRAFMIKFLNSPEVRADRERFVAYKLISNLSKLMPESSTMATINTVQGLHMDSELRRDIPGALKLIDKYADDYFRDMERISKTVDP